MFGDADQGGVIVFFVDSSHCILPGLAVGGLSRRDLIIARVAVRRRVFLARPDAAGLICVLPTRKRKRLLQSRSGFLQRKQTLRRAGDIGPATVHLGNYRSILIRVRVFKTGGPRPNLFFPSDALRSTLGDGPKPALEQTARLRVIARTVA